MHHRPRHPRPPREPLPRCSVRRVTCSPHMLLLTLLMLLSGALALVKAAQEVWWLLFDFKPLGFWWEAAFLLTKEGLVFISVLLTVLAALGMLRLRVSRRPGGGRMLYRVQRVRATLMLLSALLATAVTVLLLWGAVYYRLSVMVIGVISAIGIAMVFVFAVACRFYTNTAKVLADMNASSRVDMFTVGGGVDCFLRWQCIVLMIVLAVPAAMVLVEGMGLMWLIDFLRPIIGPIMAKELQKGLVNGTTSVYQMYGLECLQYILSIAELSLVWFLYGTYKKAHDGRR